MSLSSQPIRSYSKADQLHKVRSAPKRGKITKVTANVRKEVNRRSMELLGVDIACCERCGVSYNLSKAHIQDASQMGPGYIPWNIMNLCGTHGWKGTCHDYCDNTLDGRKWKKRYGDKLRLYYKSGNGKHFWKYEEEAK